MGFRKIFLTVAAVVMVAIVGIVGVRGMNFGIEFVGGTSIAFHNTGDASLEEVRDAFAEAGASDAVIQTTKTDGANGFLARTASTSAEEATAVANSVAETFGWTTNSL